MVHSAQAVKLAIIDVAFDAFCPRGDAGMMPIMTGTASPDHAKTRARG